MDGTEHNGSFEQGEEIVWSTGVGVRARWLVSAAAERFRKTHGAIGGAAPVGCRAVVVRAASQVLEVHWTDAMNLERQADKPVLELDGQPHQSSCRLRDHVGRPPGCLLPRESANVSPTGREADRRWRARCCLS